MVGGGNVWNRPSLRARERQMERGKCRVPPAADAAVRQHGLVKKNSRAEPQELTVGYVE